MPEKPTYEELEKRIRELEKAESESKRLEKELAHSYRLLDYIISHARSSIAVHDRDLNYLFVSKRYLEEYKVKDQNIIGKHHYEVFPDLPQKWRAVHQRSLKGEVLSAEEDPYYREDGSVDWTRWECRPWYDADDSIGGFVIFTEITNDRRQIEEELENERSFLSAVFDNIEEAIVICDAEGRLWRFNKAARNLHGIPEQPLKPDQWAEHYDLYQKDGRTPLSQKDIPLFRALKGEHIKGAEIVVAPKHSRPRFLVCNGQALRNDLDEVIGAVIAMHDITERVKAEDALRNQTKTLKNILEKAGDGICVCHNIPNEPYVKFTHWNPRMTEITGHTIEEINRLGWYQSLYPDPEMQQKAVERMASMRQGDDIKAEEWVITTKDKKQVALSMSTSVLKEDEGVVHVLAMIQDVSERKEYQDQLLVSRKEWEDIFQAIGHPTIILDPKHGIIKANKAALNLTGLTENQLKGRKCFDVFHTTDKPPGSCPMEALLHTGSLETVEMIMEALDGTFLVSCTPISDTDGNIEKIIHIATDITEAKKLESELRHAHKVEALGTLSGGIAHEFNNILGIIIGNTELALDDVPEWNPAKGCLEEIRTASLRAKDVVRQIMSFSRRTPATRKSIQISTIIQESLKLMRATIPSNIEIRQEILCKDELILANPTEINQILMNLCNNSVHAIVRETGVLKVRLETTVLDERSVAQYNGLTAGEYVKLTAKDNGSGIDPKLMGLIFDPYFTTKDVDKGLGMGLAVVYGIVKKHDGAIRVNSKVGKGTTFEVLFPITKETTQIEKEVSNDLPRGTERILFVDDEASLVKLVMQMLERQGYEVMGKTSPTEALKLFQEGPEKFDLVITDMAMPDMPGDRLAQELIKVRPTIPVIVCTGHSDRMDEGKALRSGIAAYTMKPLMKTDMVTTVRRVLDKSKDSTQ